MQTTVIYHGNCYDAYLLNLGEFKVIDHHETVEADLKDYPGCTIFNMAKSGVVLAY